MKLSELILHLQDALAREGDIPAVDAQGKPLSFVVVDETQDDQEYRPLRTYADSR